MAAKYYTYRNLNYGEHFSTKRNGVVVDYFELATIKNGKFQVSEAGRRRCLREKKRNVHAFVVSECEPSIVYVRNRLPAPEQLAEVKYNPYRAETFVNAKTGEPIESADIVYLIGGRCFIDA